MVSILRNLFSVAIVVILASSATQAQPFSLKLSAVEVRANGTSLPGKPQEVSLEMKQKSTPVTLLNQNGTTVMAVFRVSRLKSRVSEHKNSGVRMVVHYTCQQNGKTRKNRQEKIFWLEDSRQFEEEVLFNFQEGISNKPVVLAYSGALPQ
jgi:hypothetical protein